MTMRQVVEDFVNLGPLPDSMAPEDRIAQHQALLERVGRPVTDEEAAALVRCFGPDDCYGLAWTLLHIVELAPGGIPIDRAPPDDANEWIRRLWARSQRARQVR